MHPTVVRDLIHCLSAYLCFAIAYIDSELKSERSHFAAAAAVAQQQHLEEKFNIFAIFLWAICTLTVQLESSAAARRLVEGAF